MIRSRRPPGASLQRLAEAWSRDAPGPAGGPEPAAPDGADAGPVPVARLALALRAAIVSDRADEATPDQDASGDGPHGRMEAVASVLWSRFLRLDVDDPRWADRDRFVLSSGRFLPLLRALLRITGQGSVPPGCAFGHHPAVETAHGPPGQGFATAVGMAMAERTLAGRFGRTLVDHRTWVLACEADLAAGVSLEAAWLAGQMRLDKLVVLSEPPPDRGSSTASPDALTRFAASGWSVRQADAEDPDSITAAITGALRNRRPSLIACRSGAGSGRTRQSPRPASDGSAGDRQVEAAWRACGQRGAAVRRGWLRRLARHRLRSEFERTLQARLPIDWKQGCQASGAAPPPTSLEASRQTLVALCGVLPELVTVHSSAGTSLLDGLKLGDAEAAGRPLRHLPCGVQEHGMAALLNGLSLHGGLRPVLGASLVSIDRMRPALRLGALMAQPVIYLLTGDGVSPGEDGAGWQPVEQLASLRAMPEVSVFRPAGPIEVMACWELALLHDHGPSLIALCSRPVPDPVAGPGLVADEARRRGCARGGYVLAAPDRARRATLIATGPELAVALEARSALESRGIAIAVVSLPCWELFAAQPASYRGDILGTAPRFGIEAASGFGWERWLGADGVFIGMDGFGAAASAGTRDRRSGITPDAVVERVLRRLEVAS